MASQADLAGRRMQVDCELPNSSLYTFTGNLVLDGRTLPLSVNQVLLRGCMLRNTGSVLGVAIFTGHDTKVFIFLALLHAPAGRFLCAVEEFLQWCGRLGGGGEGRWEEKMTQMVRLSCGWPSSQSVTPQKKDIFFGVGCRGFTSGASGLPLPVWQQGVSCI